MKKIKKSIKDNVSAFFPTWPSEPVAFSAAADVHRLNKKKWEDLMQEDILLVRYDAVLQIYAHRTANAIFLCKQVEKPVWKPGKYEKRSIAIVSIQNRREYCRHQCETTCRTNTKEKSNDKKTMKNTKFK